jgi:hypothetical protein
MALGFEFESMKFSKGPPSAISKTIRVSGTEGVHNAARGALAALGL